MLGKSKNKKSLFKRKKKTMDEPVAEEVKEDTQYNFDSNVNKVEQEDEIEKVDFTETVELNKSTEDTSVKEVKKKKKRKPLTLRATTALCAFILALSTLFVYYFSNDSKVRVLACEGNYYYTDSQIYSMAHISKETRLWLVPSSLMETQIGNDELIESVSIKKTNGKISIKVKEKLAIAYYIEDGAYYILTIDGESHPVQDAYVNNLVHLPLMSGFKSEQRKEICERLKEKEDKLSYDIIEKISEIVPFVSSYDGNMVEFVMRDGNSVFSSLDSLTMLTKYAAVLTRLKGTSACLVLDASHNAVDKINCEDITTSRKNLVEQQSACEADGNEWDATTNTCTIKEEKDTNEDGESSEENPEESGSGELIGYLSGIDDWTYDETSGLYVSYTADYYYDPYSGTYYTWDEATGSFVAITPDDTMNYY